MRASHYLIIFSAVLILGCVIPETGSSNVFQAGDFKVDYPAGWIVGIGDNVYTFISGNNDSRVVVQRFDSNLFSNIESLGEYLLADNFVVFVNTTLGGVDAVIGSISGAEAVVVLHEDNYYSILMNGNGSFFALFKSSFAFQPYTAMDKYGFIPCSAVSSCPENYECYKFEEKDYPVCWEGSACDYCSSDECSIAESYPMQVFCS